MLPINRQSCFGPSIRLFSLYSGCLLRGIIELPYNSCAEQSLKDFSCVFVTIRLSLSSIQDAQHVAWDDKCASQIRFSLQQDAPEAFYTKTNSCQVTSLRHHVQARHTEVLTITA